MNTIYFDTNKTVEEISNQEAFENIDINEEIFNLYDYLPVLNKEVSENEYISTLFKALELSYSNRLYQFAYLQLHMIFMVSIYYMLLQINNSSPDELEKAIYYLNKNNRAKDFYGSSNTRNGELYFGSFAMLNESDVFLLLKIVGIDTDLQGELRKFVEERNKYAHANGNILIASQDTIDNKISKYVNTLGRVQNLFKSITEGLYLRTLSDPDFSDVENRLGYFDDNEQIQEELIKKFNLTKKELNICRKVDIEQLSDEKGFESMKNLHIALCRYYKGLSDNGEESSAECS